MTHKNGIILLTRQCIFKYLNTAGRTSRLFSSSAESKKDEEAVYALEEYDDRSEEKEAEIQASRNKSRLLDKHLDILKGTPPPPDSYEFHTSLKYKRKLYGMYGSSSGIDPGTLWPNQQDIDRVKEYESVAYPYTFHEMVRRAEAKHQEEQEIIRGRQMKLAENMKKLKDWMTEIETRKEKKLKELASSKEKRDKMLEEVKKQLGGNVDVKDEKFQQALKLKEKEMKKKQKEEKLKAKQERLLQSMSKEE